MNCLFVHDSKFFEYENKVYTNNLSASIWKERYLTVFDKVIVYGRKRKGDENTPYKLTLSSAEGVEFENTDYYSSALAFHLNYFKIKRELSEKISKSDYVIARVPSELGSLAISECKKQKKPYLVEVVGCPWDSLWNHSIIGKILALRAYLLQRSATKSSPFVLYVTEHFLQKRYPCHGESIGCSDVSLPEMNDESVLKNRLMKLEGFNKNKKIILGTAASVSAKYKGQQYVIKAIAKLKEEGFHFEYQLVGSGDNSYLKSVAHKCGVSDQVKFLGSMPHEKIFDWLDSIDIYIQPSKQEGLPRALIEAMSRGCPAYGSTAGGIPELLNKECIFNKGAVKEIVEKLKNINKELLLKQAKENFNKSKEYGKVILDKKRIAFYKKFVEEGKRMVLR